MRLISKETDGKINLFLIGIGAFLGGTNGNDPWWFWAMTTMAAVAAVAAVLMLIDIVWERLGL